VTKQAVAAQATEDYRSEPPSGKPAERVRVAIVAGSGPILTDDLYVVLRRRLLTLSWIMTGIFLFVTVMSLVMVVYMTPDKELMPLPSGPYEWFLNSWAQLLVMAISSISAVILWRRPPASVRGLRLIEILVVGSVALYFLRLAVGDVPYGFLEAAAGEPPRVREAFFGRYASIGGLIWCIVLTSYGAMIPNTWGRCAVVVGTLAVSPLLLFALYGFWLKPLDHQMVMSTLIRLTTYNAISSSIAIFASSRIEMSRRQAAAARKLGQYVLKERLGAGGMGEVYRAEHVLLRRPCALKLIRPDRAGDPNTLRRFEREVQVTATLTHPNTIQIFDFGHAEDGTFYYVMEYLPGLTLEELVNREGMLSPARVIHFLRQLCGALKEAHGRGLIHRDIKPGNVMVCERGSIADVAKLLDFGLVLPIVSETDGEKLTQDGSVIGTPAYLSPEQAGGQEALDARSDIYSVGALAYFLLTRQPPFANRSGVKMLAAHLYEEPEPLSRRRPDVPADLQGIILRCLAKEPSARFPDAASLDAALSLCCAASQYTEKNAALSSVNAAATGD
jgi:eukaryotic-like serine/threonine-protein kinase